MHVLVQETTGPCKQHALHGGHHYWMEGRKGQAALMSLLVSTLGAQLSVHTTWLPRPNKPKPERAAAAVGSSKHGGGGARGAR